MTAYLWTIIAMTALISLPACGPAEFTSIMPEDSPSKSGEPAATGTPEVPPNSPPPGNPPADPVPPTVVVDDPPAADPYLCGHKKYLICHVPEGNPDNRHELCLPAPAIEAHLRQHDASGASGDEDYMGPCYP